MLKPIPQTFTRWGYTGRILKREGDVVLAEKQDSKKPERKFYEVMLVQKHNGFTIAGKTFPPSEYLPRDDQWGEAGWSCSTIARAQEVFQREVGKSLEGT
jgi:hypothetical protein